MQVRTIYLGGDHAGVLLKARVKAYLEKKGYVCHDYGSFDAHASDDYVDFVVLVARAVARSQHALGIVFGGSGQGEGIAANKIKGVRSCVYYGGTTTIVKRSREHNNANVLSLGARFVTVKDALRAVRVFMDTSFSRDVRHVRRNNKVNRLGGR